jgi:hypothetical protein
MPRNEKIHREKVLGRAQYPLPEVPAQQKQKKT